MDAPSRSLLLVRRAASALRAPRPWRWLLAGLVIAVCALALTPAPPRELTLGWDKLNHAAAFAALSVSGCFGFPHSRRSLVIAMLALLGFGGLIEVVQAYVPGRSSDWADLLADSIGLLLGLAIALPMLRLTRKAAAPSR